MKWRPIQHGRLPSARHWRSVVAESLSRKRASLPKIFRKSSWMYEWGARYVSRPFACLFKREELIPTIMRLRNPARYANLNGTSRETLWCLLTVSRCARRLRESRGIRGMTAWRPGDYKAKSVVPRPTTLVWGHCQCRTLIRFHRVKFPGIGRPPKRKNGSSNLKAHGSRYFLFFFKKRFFSSRAPF